MLVPIFLVSVGTVGLFSLGKVANIYQSRWYRKSSLPKEIRFQILYQSSSIIMASSLVRLSSHISGYSLTDILRIGDINAPVREENFLYLGISPTDTWMTVGPLFSFWPFIATSVVVYMQIMTPFRNKHSLKDIFQALLWSLPFSLMNSLTEELIFRVIPIISTKNTFHRSLVSMLSGIMFGIPHYLGTPGGFIGVIMASFLGWVMAESLLDTQGIGWAWLIHFVQDVPIIAMKILVHNKQ
jgi:membrane protease YdiL (CAAX protease family)